MRRLLLACVGLLGAAGTLACCALSTPTRRETAVSWPVFDDAELASLDEAAWASLIELEAPRSGPNASPSILGLERLRTAIARGPGEFRAALAAEFTPAPPAAVLVTAYFEPTLAARRAPDARFCYPIYRPPARSAAAGAVSPESGLTRAAIESGALAGQGLELFWADDPIGLFFLQVQGSGRLELADGSVARVGFAGSNGQPYVSIGKMLVDRGALERGTATAPVIKAYLRAHPEELASTLAMNPRYVFFRVLDLSPRLGPPGSLGASLVAFRSVAVDPAVTPLGSIGILSTTLPDGRGFSSLVIAMDTGAAISGSSRVDLFVGAGREAEAIAGELHAPGELFWLRASHVRTAS